MPGFELVGQEELEQIQALFDQRPANLYRYGAGNYMVREFEEKFADRFGVKYAHAVSSGTAAIHCALAGIGIGPGDEVITTALLLLHPSRLFITWVRSRYLSKLMRHIILIQRQLKKRSRQGQRQLFPCLCGRLPRWMSLLACVKSTTSCWWRMRRSVWEVRSGVKNWELSDVLDHFRLIQAKH